jgi:hypothetical protein
MPSSFDVRYCALLGASLLLVTHDRADTLYDSLVFLGFAQPYKSPFIFGHIIQLTYQERGLSGSAGAAMIGDLLLQHFLLFSSLVYLLSHVLQA